jgi:hypothetical protein
MLNYFQPLIPLPKLAFGLSAGYIFDSLFIFRLGEILRIYISTARSSYKIKCAMASSIFIERLLDLVSIWLISCILLLVATLINLNSEAIIQLIQTLTLSLAILFAIILIVVTNRQLVRKTIHKLTSEAGLVTRKYVLYFFFSLISSLKNIPKLEKKNILAITLKMWTLYLLSYISLGYALMPNENAITNLISVWHELYKYLNFQNFLVTVAQANIFNQLIVISYFMAPSLLLLIYVFTQRKKYLESQSRDTIHLLPFSKESNQLNFLESYFSIDSTRYANSFLELNRNSIVVSDFTGGSGDITLLIEEAGQKKFRKIAGVQGNNRIGEQVKRLQYDTSSLFCKISAAKNFNEIEYYEMPSRFGAVPMWEKLHSIDAKNASILLNKICTVISTELHKDIVVNSEESLSLITSYYSEKMNWNSTSVIDAVKILNLDPNEPILINEHQFLSPFAIQAKINAYDFVNVWKNDSIGNIHGDLSLENVIWDPSESRGFYLIDPLGSGKPNSTYIDFSKTRLSLTFPIHMEAFLNVETVRRNEFIVQKSINENNLFLIERFDQHITCGSTEKEDSMKVHEFFNLLRTLRYKKDRDALAVLLELALRIEGTLL